MNTTTTNLEEFAKELQEAFRDWEEILGEPEGTYAIPDNYTVVK